MGFYLRAWHGLVPEEKEQDYDRDRNAEQPEKYASSHKSSPLFERQRRRGVLGSGIEAAPGARGQSLLEHGPLRLNSGMTVQFETILL